MNIDWSAFPDDATDSPAPMAREPLSDGIHSGVIDRATIESGWRVTDDNPSGDCLSVWLDCEEGGGKKRVFVTVPITQIGRISAIARACGVEPPQRGSDHWDEATLIGKSCTVETSQYVVQNGPKAGETRASVRRWLAPEHVSPIEPVRKAPQAPPPAMKTARAAKPAKGGSDDIPF